MTRYPKFFLNKGRILALWVMYCIQPKNGFKRKLSAFGGEKRLPLLTKNALMNNC